MMSGVDDDNNDGQMIFGDLRGICLTGEEKPRKNLTQETCPDQGSNPDPLRDRRACCHLVHSGGREGEEGEEGDGEEEEDEEEEEEEEDNFKIQQNSVPMSLKIYRLVFNGEGLLLISSSTNPQAEGPPHIGCPQVLIQHICSYPPYKEAVSYIRNLRTARGTHII